MSASQAQKLFEFDGHSVSSHYLCEPLGWHVSPIFFPTFEYVLSHFVCNFIFRAGNEIASSVFEGGENLIGKKIRPVTDLERNRNL